MNFTQVYQHYQIPPNLQQHQLRVAGITYLIAKHWQAQPKIDPVLMARVGLVHDMGNILKFGLNSKTAKRYGLTNLSKWQQVQQEFRRQYGPDEVKATFAICRELDLEQELAILQREHQIYDPPKIAQSPNNWPVKIFLYADMRVAPQGIVSLEKRLKDFFARYHLDQPEWFKAGQSIENQLQARTTIDITSINETQLQPLYSQFLHWQV